ncbi:DUF3019 domain-containing protein [Thalassotalea euphylliae]|uniref:DUF3019 domain-containing protein n=1 Tax=Thalassotalea euphylliae TaxID=1655234 RepID=A0A3E0U1E9_9GAMM|nr:DUF3019 domain-containing protein [Thalassotalea euphylliae]REL30530.1 DUF3019 domain-containing protein [Thalassotalea euphylliae]
MDFLMVRPHRQLLAKLAATIGLILPMLVISQVQAQAQNNSALAEPLSQQSSKLGNQASQANQANLAGHAKSPMLIASPNVCELASGTYLCSMKAALIWEMPHTGHYCLYEQEELEPLQCWQNQWSGSHVMMFESDKPVTYILRSYQSANLLGDAIVQANINVIGTLEQRIRAKRRRRFLRIF